MKRLSGMTKIFFPVYIWKFLPNVAWNQNILFFPDNFLTFSIQDNWCYKLGDWKVNPIFELNTDYIFPLWGGATLPEKRKMQ